MALVVTWFVLCVAALLAAGRAARRSLAVAVAASSTIVPLVICSFPLVRVIAGIAAAVGVARTVDLVREQRSRPADARVLQVIIVFDWRQATRATRQLDLRGALRTVVYASLATLAVLCVFFTRTHSLMLWLGSLGAAIAIWAAAEALSTLVTVLVRLTGWSLPSLHHRPIESKTLAELWGSRWNLTVTRWLHATVFLPVARRHGARVGLLATFVVSALFHAYIAFAGGGARLALWMGSFFIVQALLVLLERALGVGRWPALAARTWILTGMLLPSPLFTEPMVAVSAPALSPLAATSCSCP